MSPRNELAEFLVTYVSDLDDQVTLTSHEDGWDLEPSRMSASPVTVRGHDPDLQDLVIRFGSLGEFDFDDSRLSGTDVLEEAKLVVRGVGSGGLIETRRGRDGSRWRGTRWTLRLPDGRVRRGFMNWIPLLSRGTTAHWEAWHERA